AALAPFRNRPRCCNQEELAAMEQHKPRTPQQASIFYGERAGRRGKISAPPVPGEKCFLTSPFIEQALSLTTNQPAPCAAYWTQMDSSCNVSCWRDCRTLSSRLVPK